MLLLQPVDDGGPDPGPPVLTSVTFPWDKDCQMTYLNNVLGPDTGPEDLGLFNQPDPDP